MYNEQTLKKALEKFDWAAVLSHLPNCDEKCLQKLLGDITRTGVLIRVFSISESIEKRRAQFIDELKVFVAGSGIKGADKYLRYLLSQVEITEAAFSVIDTTLTSDGFSSFSESQQAWSILEWAAREMQNVHRQTMDGLRASAECRSAVIDPLTLRLDKAHGQGLADGSYLSTGGDGSQYTSYAWTPTKMVQDRSISTSTPHNTDRGRNGDRARRLALGRCVAGSDE